MKWKTPPWLAFLIGVAVFLVARQFSHLPEVIFGESLMEAFPWLGQVSSKSGLLILSVLGSLILTRGALRKHGYQWPQDMRWWSSFWPGVVAGTIATLLIFVTPSKGMGGMMMGMGGPGVMVFLLLFSSLAEEVHARAFVQSLMWHLRDRRIDLGVTRVSVPTFTSALLFGLLHLPVYFAGVDIWTMAIVLSQTFVLGLLAGHVFEKHESIVPAITMHIGGNIGGALCGIVIMVLRGLITGELPTP